MVHADDELDIGGNAENLLRNAPCAVLLSQRDFRPQIERQLILPRSDLHASYEVFGQAGVDLRLRQQHPDLERSICYYRPGHGSQFDALFGGCRQAGDGQGASG